ncbi:hypothetical protein BV20DRAFT_965871, partial [Pilatotrama ljubarskyi]
MGQQATRPFRSLYLIPRSLSRSSDIPGLPWMLATNEEFGSMSYSPPVGVRQHRYTRSGERNIAEVEALQECEEGRWAAHIGGGKQLNGGVGIRRGGGGGNIVWTWHDHVCDQGICGDGGGQWCLAAVFGITRRLARNAHTYTYCTYTSIVPRGARRSSAVSRTGTLMYIRWARAKMYSILAMVLVAI